MIMAYHSQSIAAQGNNATGNNINAQHRLEVFGTLPLHWQAERQLLSSAWATLLGSPQASASVQDTALWIWRES